MKKTKEVHVNGLHPANGVTTVTKEYETSVDLSHKLRSHGNYTLGVVLTLVEAALGDTPQAKALKQSIRKEMFAMMERNQGDMYVAFGQQDASYAPSEIHIEIKQD